MAGFSRKDAKRHYEMLEKIAKLQKEVGKDFGTYINGIKDLGKQQAQVNALLEQEALFTYEIAQARAELAVTAVADPRYAELENQIAAHKKLRKQHRLAAKDAVEHLEILKKTVKEVGLANLAYKGMGKAWDKIPGLAKKTYRWVTDLKALEMSKEIKQAELSMGILSNQSKFFSKTMSKASESTIQIGFGIKDMAKSQAEYSESIGRSMMLSERGYEAMAEIAKGTSLGVEGAATMAASMEGFGLSVEGSRDAVQETVDAAYKMGANATKTLKELGTALKMAQKYHFKGGVTGMADMAAYASKMNMDMENVSSMAEKVFRPEGAVEMSARLATMGGQMARLGDPFTLMFKARNDMEGFMKDVGAAASEFAQFNEKTGEFDINGLQLDRMRELADITGLSVENMSEMARAGAKFNKIESLIPSVVSDKEDRELIASLAKFDKDSGQWEVTMNGGTKFLSEMNQSELRNYKREQESLKERAKQAQTFDDAFNNLVSQFQTMALPFIEALTENLVGPLNNLQERMQKEGWIDSIKEFATTMGNIVGVLGKWIVNNPITTALTYIGGKVFFNLAQWYANGKALRAGFGIMGSGIPGMKGVPPTATGAAGVGSGAATKMGMGGGFGRNLKGGGAIGGGLLAAGMSGYNEWTTNAEEGMSTGENVGRTVARGAGAGLGAWGGAAAGAAIGSVVPVVGTAIGGIIGGILGGMGGDFLGDKLGDVGGAMVNDGIVQFNPQDKFLKADDGVIASTQKGKLDDLIGGKSGGGGGNSKMEFGDMKLNGEIVIKDANGGNVHDNLLKDPFFIKEMTQLVQQQLSINISGGKLNPNPVG